MAQSLRLTGRVTVTVVDSDLDQKTSYLRPSLQALGVLLRTLARTSNFRFDRCGVRPSHQEVRMSSVCRRLLELGTAGRDSKRTDVSVGLYARNETRTT